MDIIKNIDKLFILDGNFVKKELRIKTPKELGKIIAKISDLNMEEVTFTITDIENSIETVETIIEALIINLNIEVVKYKKVAFKVIKAWEDSPDEFKIKKLSFPKDEEIFERKGLLSDNQYHISLFILFFNYYKSFGHGFTTGCGNYTFYEKGYYETQIEEVDSWVSKIVKELKTTKIKDRFKKYLINNDVSISHKKLERFVKLSDEKVDVKSEPNPPFPMKIDGGTLNSILSNGEEYFEIDDDFIIAFKEEYNVDLSPLVDWEVSYGTNDTHHNDGQICEYFIEFSSPEGHIYNTTNEHCLMTGWNFNDGEIIF